LADEPLAKFALREIFFLLTFYLVSGVLPVSEAVVLPTIERLFNGGRAREQIGDVFVIVVIRIGEPRSPSKIDIDRFRCIRIELGDVLATTKLGRVFLGIVQIGRGQTGKGGGKDSGVNPVADNRCFMGVQPDGTVCSFWYSAGPPPTLFTCTLILGEACSNSFTT